MATPVKPMLSSKGWSTEPSSWMTDIFFDTFKVDKSQAFGYGDNVSSFQYLATLYRTDDPSFRSEVEKMYTRLYSRYFDSVDVVIEQENPDNFQGNYSLVISASYQGKTYNLAERLQIMQDSGEATILEEL